ncbi:MAG: acyl carrier protein [Rhodospirillales bacterium]|jgi:acyl carrier protein|nr:acyl carrier protein [Rhodospirillales bacterium]
MASVKEDVIEVIRETCDASTLNLEDGDRSLLEQGLDSLDFASVLMAIEDKFDIEIPSQDELDELGSINKISAFVDGQLNGPGAAPTA